MSKIARIRFKKHVTKTEIIYAALRRAIRKGDLRPNQSLNTARLAKQFSVSINPVREALRTLQETGLIKYTPHKGYAVHEPSVSEIKDIFLIFSALWCLAAGLAFTNINERVVQSLEGLLTKAKNSIVKGDLDSYSNIALQFHNVILKCAHSKLLAETIDSFWERVLLMTRDRKTAKRLAKEDQEEHRRMIDLVRSGCKEEFVELMGKHELDHGQVFVNSAKKR